MARRKGMSESDLAAAIGSQLADSRLYYGSDRQTHHEWALRFFAGEVDFAPMGPDRSKVVSRDVSDVHGLVMPSLLRVFFASDSVAIYEPTKPEHEEYAEDATALVNYIVLRECAGYRHFRDAFSEGLLVGNGVMKHWWDHTPTYHTDHFTNVSQEQRAVILQDVDIEDVEEESYPDPDFTPPPMPSEEELMAMAAQAMAQGVTPEQIEAQMAEMQAAQIPPLRYDIKIKRMVSKGRLRLAAVPSEEFLIERAATVLDESVRFCAHIQRKTRSDLIKEGYKRDVIEDLPAWTNALEDETARDARDNISYRSDQAPDRSTEFIEVAECYVLIDFDGDGMAERRRVVMAGGKGQEHILVNEEWGDDLPFSDIVPDPQAHTWRGRGLFDKLDDIQRIKTVALRGVLDNTYQILNPQRDVEVGSYENMDEVVNPTFGGVLLRKQGRAPMQPVAVNYIAPQVVPLIDYLDGVSEARTGVSKRSMALDMDALQNQSATAVNAAQSGAMAKVEEYVRNIAEHGGMQRIFTCILRLITKHQDRAKSIRINGEWKETDPRGWLADMNVTINTGLGTGSRERDFAVLNGVASKIEQVVMQAGPFNEFANIGHLFKTYQKSAEAAGLKNADSYFPTITQEQVAEWRQKAEAQAQQGDPKMLEAQANMQIEQAKLQQQMQAEQARMQMDMQKAQAEFEMKRAEAEAQRQADVERIAKELQLKREQMQIEAQLRREQIEAEMALKRELAMLELQTKQAISASHALTNVQMGGDVG